MRVFASQRFKKRYKRLPKRIKERAKRQEALFVKNPFDSRLETHKLHGKDREHWAFSIDKKYRIKFLFLNGDSVLYLDIGTHDEIY